MDPVLQENSKYEKCPIVMGHKMRNHHGMNQCITNVMCVLFVHVTCIQIFTNVHCVLLVHVNCTQMSSIYM